MMFGNSNSTYNMPEKANMLTKFEKAFGEYLDHEIIKSVLQNFDWDPSASFTALLELSPIPSNKVDHIANLRRQLGLTLERNAKKTKVTVIPTITNPGKSQQSSYKKLASDFQNSWNKNPNVKVTDKTGQILKDSFDCELQSKFTVQRNQLTRVPESVAAYINSGVKVMVIMRGLPGSGKSTLAKMIISRGGTVVSADDYFLTRDGQYKYDQLKISDAHQCCRTTARSAIKRGDTPVVIDNTNVELWEMRPYVVMAREFNYQIEFVEPQTDWKFKPPILAKYNSHNVPKQKISDMLSRYFKNVKITDFNIEGKNNIKKINNINGKNSDNIAVLNDNNFTINSTVKNLTEEDKDRDSEDWEGLITNFSNQSVHSEARATVVQTISNNLKSANFGQSSEDYQNVSSNTLGRDEGNRISTFVRPKSEGASTARGNSSTEKSSFINATEDNTSDDASSTDFMIEKSPEGADSWICLNEEQQWDSDENKLNPNAKQNGPLSERRRKNRRNRRSPPCQDKSSSETGNEGTNEWTANNEISTWDADDNAPPSKDTGAVPKRSRCEIRNISKDTSDENNCSEEELHISYYEEVQPEQNLENLNISEKTVNLLSKHCQTAFGEIGNESLKVLHGNPDRYILGDLPALSSEGAITKGNLFLDKGSMTEQMGPTSCGSIEHLKACFPSIPEDDLVDILETCNGDLNWATDILVTDGYVIEGSFSCDECSSGFSSSPGSSVSSSPATSDHEESSTESAQSPTNKTKKHKKRKSKIPATELFQYNLPKRDSSEKWNNQLHGPRRNIPGKQSDECNLSNTQNTFVSSIPESKKPVRSNSPGSSVNEDSLHDSESLNTVSLEMDPLFAYQLLNIFGPVGNLNLNHEFTSEERRINIPLDLCNQLHNLWGATIMNAKENDDRIIKDFIAKDAEQALKLQIEENQKNNESSGPNTFFEKFDCENPPTSFKEIMDLEKALEKSLPANEKKMSFKLSELRLCEDFHHVDSCAVKDMLAACNGKTDEAYSRLLSKYGSPQSSRKNSLTNGQGYKDCGVAEIDVENIREKEKTEHEDLLNCYAEISDECCDLQKCTDEYNIYYNYRRDLIERARLSNGPYKNAVASHYTQEAMKYSMKMFEANVRCSRANFKQINTAHDPNTLDLHYLRVPVALTTTMAFLDERQRTLNASVSYGGTSRTKVSLITGYGKRSPQHVAKLKPAVMALLKKNDYKCTECPINPGVVIVSLVAKTF